MNVIEVNNLRKEFVSKKKRVKENGKTSLFKKDKVIKRAVDDISFCVNEGEALAFIGPNGAGKSTTIKMLTGILYPTSGSVKVMGLDPSKDRIKLSYQIGTVFGQKEQLWVHLSAMDNFKFFGAIYDIRKEKLEKRIKELADLFEVNEFINQPVKSLSLGQRMKCEMIASLIHEPKVLFFDEPTIGLDPIAKETLRKLIKKINKELNTTIIFTSHDVGDIEEVCKRVIIINDGKIVLDDSMKNLKYHYLNKKIIEVNMKNNIKIEKTAGVQVIKSKDTLYKIEADLNQTTMADVMKLFNPDDIQDITISSTPLEEIIKDIYKRREHE
ncbi:MAG: ATP-binding cassette domain-containing protein [Clostridiales bacterium]|nr:ATP-binding cassette domain-containing protein [Clostridiales bacterium]